MTVVQEAKDNFIVVVKNIVRVQTKLIYTDCLRRMDF